MNSHRHFHIVQQKHQTASSSASTSCGTYSSLIAAMPLIDTGLDWEVHLAQWGQEDWAKLFYLHICCDYSLKDVFQLFSMIEVKAAPLEVAAADYFDAHLKNQVPAFLQRFLDYDEYAKSCRDEGFMSSFIFDAQEFTAIGYA